MIKYLSLFSGIGAFEKALQNLHIPYDLMGYCEIDKYASNHRKEQINERGRRHHFLGECISNENTQKSESRTCVFILRDCSVS